MMRDSFALEPRPAVSAPKGASSITAAVAVATVTIIATAVPGNTFQMTIKRRNDPVHGNSLPAVTRTMAQLVAVPPPRFHRRDGYVN